MADPNAIKAGEAYVEITGQTAALQKSMADLSGQISHGLGNAAGEAAQSSAGAFMALGRKMAGVFGLALGAGAVVSFAKSSVQITAQMEEAHRGLAGVMQQEGLYTEQAYQKNIQLAHGLAMSTKATREQIEQVMAMGYQWGIQNSDIDKATKLAIGWSRIMGIDVPEAMKMMMMAMSGRSQRAQLMFERYGVNFGQAMTPGARMTAMEPIGTEGFQRVQYEMGGLAGQINETDKAFIDFKEQLGAGIIEGARLAETLRDTTDALDNSGSQATLFGELLGIAGGTILNLIITPFRLLAAGVQGIAGLFVWLFGKLAEAASHIPMIGMLFGVPKMLEARDAQIIAETGKNLLDSGADQLEMIGKDWWRLIHPDVTMPGTHAPPGILPKPPGDEMAGGMMGGAGIVSGIQLAGAAPGQISYPGGGVSNTVAEQSRDALGDILEGIRNIDRKTPVPETNAYMVK